MAKTREQIDFEKEAAASIEFKAELLDVHLRSEERKKRQTAAQYASELWEFLKQHEAEVVQGATAASMSPQPHIRGAGRALLTGVTIGETAAKLEEIQHDIQQGHYSCWTLSTSLANLCFEELESRYANAHMALRAVKRLDPAGVKKVKDLMKKIFENRVEPLRPVCAAVGEPHRAARPAHMFGKVNSGGSSAPKPTVKGAASQPGSKAPAAKPTPGSNQKQPEIDRTRKDHDTFGHEMKEPDLGKVSVPGVKSSDEVIQQKLDAKLQQKIKDDELLKARNREGLHREAIDKHNSDPKRNPDPGSFKG